MRYFNCLFLFVLCFAQKSELKAQTLANSTGQTIVTSQYLIEYSVGEVAITTYSNAKIFLTQGLLQPNIKILLPDCEIINQQFQYFPNPTYDKLRLVGRNDWIDSYQIFAMDGKLVRNERFYNNEINLTNLAAAAYIVRLLPGCDGNFKTLKIIKATR